MEKRIFEIRSGDLLTDVNQTAEYTGQSIRKLKKLSTSDKKYVSREIAKYSRIIWGASRQAGLSNLMNIAEHLFYEACITAGGSIEIEKVLKNE